MKISHDTLVAVIASFVLSVLASTCNTVGIIYLSDHVIPTPRVYEQEVPCLESN